MYILDNDGKRVEAECSFGFLDGSHCVVVESSGGSDKERGIERRNPDYNILLRVIFSRLAVSGRRITQVVLDSKKVTNLPLAERIAMLADFPYPIELASTDVESFRKSLQREIATMHQDPGAKGGGNSQKRIRVCLDESLSSDQRLAFAGRTELQDPDEEFPPGTRETEKEYLRKSRVGQGEFRNLSRHRYR